MPRDPSVKRWLGGVKPAWTSLGRASFADLHEPPSPFSGPIRLATDLSADDIARSAVARNALVLLDAAAVAPGLELTATGNLSRKVVARMMDLFDWPGFDRAMLSDISKKAINEPDFIPLLFVRQLVQHGRLVMRRRNRLRTTQAGRRFLEGPSRQALQALLFHLAFWLIELDRGYGPNPGWPQSHVGVVLWSLSRVAGKWRSAERLTRLCTMPTEKIVTSDLDFGTFSMHGAILTPLLWFGLLEERTEPVPGNAWQQRYFYRKTPLFDRFLFFDIGPPAAAAPTR